MKARNWFVYDLRTGTRRSTLPVLILVVAALALATSLWYFAAARPISPEDVIRLKVADEKAGASAALVDDAARKLLIAAGDVGNWADRLRRAESPATAAAFIGSIETLAQADQAFVRAQFRDDLARAELRHETEVLSKKVGKPSFADGVTTAWLSAAASLAWPLLIAAAVAYFLFSESGRRRLDLLFGRFQTVKLFSAEFVLSSGEKERASDAVDRYRAEVMNTFDGWVTSEDIKDRLAEVMKAHVKPHLEQIGKPGVAFRATIHVPDMLFQDSLYQLVDYYTTGEATQNPRGRIKSIRFGFIGKVWRSRENDVQGTVPQDPSILVRDWGMTVAEAKQAGVSRSSFVGCLLHDRYDRPIAIVYLDSLEASAFGTNAADRRILEIIAKGCEETGLSRALARMHYASERTVPLVTLYK